MSMNTAWAESRPAPPADRLEARVEAADVDALWRWIEALMSGGTGRDSQSASEPRLSWQLRQCWRKNIGDLVEIGRAADSSHPLDAEVAARWVREGLRHDLGHRASRCTKPAAITNLQADTLQSLTLATTVEIAQRYPKRANGRELPSVALARQGGDGTLDC